MRVRDCNRTVLGTDSTAGAFRFINKTRVLQNFDVEIPGMTRDFLDLGSGDDPDIWRPTGLYQFWRQNSDSAVVGGKGLIQTRHDAADCRRSLNQVDIKSGVGKIHSGLNSSDPTTDNHYGADSFFSDSITHLRHFFLIN